MSNWNYFAEDRFYSEQLRKRLERNVVMRSAKAMAFYLKEFASNDPLSVVDFGSGPGHYYPALAEGNLNLKFYRGVDFDVENIDFGNRYYSGNAGVEFLEMDITGDIQEALSGVNAVISANTLPHIPNVDSFFHQISANNDIKVCIVRMLIGNECVQIKKHLSDESFESMFDLGFQHNNIYSESYLSSLFDKKVWSLSVQEDLQDWSLPDQNSIEDRVRGTFYSNRVSRAVGDMTFKGDIYMPWKFFIALRK